MVAPASKHRPDHVDDIGPGRCRRFVHPDAFAALTHELGVASLWFTASA
jgi:hypothetical protein